MVASQRLGRRMKAAAERGPQVVLDPMPLDSDPFCQGSCGECPVHQSPHVKQNHAPPWETTLTSWSKSYGDQRVATGAGL